MSQSKIRANLKLKLYKKSHANKYENHANKINRH